MVSFISWSYAFCFLDVSVQVLVNAVSNSAQSTSSSLCTWFGWVVSMLVTRLPSWVFTQSVTMGPQMYVMAVSTLSYALVIEFGVQLTSLYHRNFAGKSSA